MNRFAYLGIVLATLPLAAGIDLAMAQSADTPSATSRHLRS
jgi:hypothetical protein